MRLTLAHIALFLQLPPHQAFTVTRTAPAPTANRPRSTLILRSESSSDAFASFADSLEEEDFSAPIGESTVSASATTTSTKTRTTTTTTTATKEAETETWQSKLETLLDPSTPLAQRQILLSELLTANQEIRDSVLLALSQRKIDPLLTPTGRKLQDGTRAVARQLTNDILPNVLETPPPMPDIDLLPKIGSKVLNALSNQAKKTFDDFTGDLADPSRIPQRITQQSQGFAQEAKNMFLETPEGLQGPAYNLVAETAGYQIRDYEGYTVASTTMGKVGEPYNMNDVANSGAAFNALAAYLFGANSEAKMMPMTTPVTTTLGGEMRFYLKNGSVMADFPTPIEQDSDGVFETGAVQLVDIPPARLAVRKFTGFVTEGEVARQKDVLLQELELDGWEIDVDHGAIVPHVVFQYNPPYTIPVIRRNEIAVPMRNTEEPKLEEEWDVTKNDAGKETTAEAPSDVE